MSVQIILPPRRAIQRWTSGLQSRTHHPVANRCRNRRAVPVASARGARYAHAAPLLCYRIFMPVSEARAAATTSASVRIIAAGIVIAFCYWASTVVVAVLVAVLMAYFLDPVVTGLEKLFIPRALGSLIVVLITLSLMVVLAWSLVQRVDQFGADWPQYRAQLREAVAGIEHRLDSLQAHVSEITPASPSSPQILQVTESRPVGSALYAQLANLYPVIFAATFIPFLLFFMLAAKRQVWHATMQLFPAAQRNDVKETLEDVTQVLRSYLAGTTLVGLILVLTSWLFFLVDGPRLPVPHGARFRVDESGPVSWSAFIVGAAISDWIETIPHGWSVYRNCSDNDFPAHYRGEPADSRSGWLACTVKRAGADHITAFLGLAMGTDGADSGDSHHGSNQGRLRPRGRLGARGPLA